ncbi:putative polyol transporter 1 [Pseudocercospora fuligena]|uniref:Putative polyol transporter 1 n=1 Tax=Pseudocercospora fuligena TaxID=685502 RepID=A0A8H6RBP9_9PEZI|nr:putative polyol transporter 1 [Pseudocercospora fuligena]
MISSQIHLERQYQFPSGESDDLFDKSFSSIKKALTGIPKEDLLRSVDTYAKDHGLIDIVDLLKKGALAAQNPDYPETIFELTAEDIKILQDEKLHRWRHPRTLYFMIILSSIGAAIQGWDQTGSNGANLSFPQEFGIADSGDLCESQGSCEKNSWIVGAINAAPYIAICLFACWLSDPINHYLGRRGTIFVASMFSLLAPIGQAVAQTWPQILVCRILLGIGMGLKEVTVPVFSAENAPSRIRGALTMSWLMWVAFGTMVGFSANLAVANVDIIAWRLQLGSALIPAVPLLLGIYFVPQSAKWLIRKKRHRDAFQSLLRLRNSPLQAARDLYYIRVQLEGEKAFAVEDKNKMTAILQIAKDLFTVPRIRRATQASGIIMIAQQMCGINIVAFYSSTIFVQGGFSQTVALWVS